LLPALGGERWPHYCFLLRALVYAPPPLIVVRLQST